MPSVPIEILKMTQRYESSKGKMRRRRPYEKGGGGRTIDAMSECIGW